MTAPEAVLSVRAMRSQLLACTAVICLWAAETAAADVTFTSTGVTLPTAGEQPSELVSEDFNNDAIDAGDVGSGHTVTAIYEITPANSDARMVDETRYPENRRPAASRGSRDEYGFLKIRYKLPGQSKSRLLERPIPLTTRVGPDIRREVTFSTAVAGFGQLLRGGSFTGPLTYEDVISQAHSATGEDRFGYRAEFVQLVRKAEAAQKK